MHAEEKKKHSHTKSKIVQCLEMWGMDFNVLFSYQTFVVLVVVSIFCLSRNYNQRDLKKKGELKKPGKNT